MSRSCNYGTVNLMKCVDPVLCYIDSKGNRKFRHFSHAKVLLVTNYPHILFNCGKCIFCRKKRSYELAVRCVLHASLYQQNCFLTLTYDEEKEGYHNEFNYRDIQLFKKRLRRLTRQRVEIFNVHEYGKKGKKHWHLVVFNFNFNDKTYFTSRKGIPYYISETLKKIWPHGMHTIGDVNEASSMYQAQYMEKDIKNSTVKTRRASHSKHSGLGKQYFYQHYKQLLRLGYIPFNGLKIPLPRYFQKLAERHYSHFYCKTDFVDTITRKAKFRPFKKEEPNKEIADLYIEYKNTKDTKIKELEQQWEEFVQQWDYKTETDFQKSGQNAVYDLRNKQQLERF